MLAVSAVLAAGCGSAGSAAKAVASCLNGHAFLVRPRGTAIEGASRGGVTFTLTIYKTAPAARAAGARLSPKTALVVGRAVVDFKGNAPISGHPAKLATPDEAIVRNCLAKHAK